MSTSGIPFRRVSGGQFLWREKKDLTRVELASATTTNVSPLRQFAWIEMRRSFCPLSGASMQ